MGFSHTYHPEGLNTTLLSPGCVLENGSHYGNGGQNIHQRQGAGEEPLIAQVLLNGELVLMSSQ